VIAGQLVAPVTGREQHLLPVRGVSQRGESGPGLPTAGRR
jgi:hypothetical protein